VQISGAGSHLEQCNATGCDNAVCSAACHFGERNQFSILQKQAFDLFLEMGLPTWSVTIIPRSSYRTTRLASFSINAFQQSLRRRFSKAESKCGAPIFAFGGIEASYDIQFNGSAKWSPHAHTMIATTISKKKLLKYLRGRGPFPKGSKPIVIKPSTNLANGLDYATKRYPAQRTRSRDKRGNKDWKKQEVEATQRVEYDTWLLGLNNTQTLILRGLKRFRGGLKLIGKRGGK
jgi:hypothetical protein